MCKAMMGSVLPSSFKMVSNILESLRIMLRVRSPCTSKRNALASKADTGISCGKEAGYSIHTGREIKSITGGRVYSPLSVIEPIIPVPIVISLQSSAGHRGGIHRLPVKTSCCPFGKFSAGLLVQGSQILRCDGLRVKWHRKTFFSPEITRRSFITDHKTGQKMDKLRLDCKYPTILHSLPYSSSLSLVSSFPSQKNLRASKK